MHVSNLFYTEPMARLAQRLWRSRASAAASSSPTPAPRRTSARSRSPASTPTGAASRRRRSSASRASSTAAPTAPSRRRRRWRATRRSARCCPASARFRATTPRRCARRSAPNTAAVLIEPIQGEAGVYPTSDEALLAAREACDEAGALLIFDEIQTGMGRTGSLWAYQQTPVRPDVHHQRQGARRRPPDRRLHHRRRWPPTCSSPATTARPSPAARSRPRRRSPSSTSSTTRRCCGGCASWGRGCARAWRRSTGVREVRGRGLMIGVGLEHGDRRRGGRRRPAAARPGRQRAGAGHAAAAAAAGGRVEQIEQRGWTDRRIALGFVGPVSEKNRPLRRDSLETMTAERLAAIVAAAERAATKVIDDAEAEARRYIDDAKAEADDALAGADLRAGRDDRRADRRRGGDPPALRAPARGARADPFAARLGRRGRAERAAPHGSRAAART